MGQAKSRSRNRPATVYHHTSFLRTNLLWMSGQVNLEGQSPPVRHPGFPREIQTDATARRPLVDFPAVAWFTTRVDIPNCLRSIEIQVGKVRRRLTENETNGMMLRRVALGFPIADIGVVHWPTHPGYGTSEGRELNESARDAGDDPDDWYVADAPVDLMNLSEAWVAPDIFKPKLQRQDWYVADVKKMVDLCRTTPGVYIPPAWLGADEARKLTRNLGIPGYDPAAGRRHNNPADYAPGMAPHWPGEATGPG